eukprot:CAMPEP_0198345690 /NCGR_PEP_ID=MMETSP1450-20131203/75460_1 /TAXON_ID=753684 ORGANISM="Madagascaria erythrocladiodes, Strain CCMP3234" /NCGR_SAMPLE_ID=MMETSP1450 /ASSEMBLY_ACC=CAM_ASM_001115 /LENGTH=135 /DNA_ID=CAMNT_0044051057 /DNA_START=62 /DNA_END=466 /DNA_ORIENTATION=+
MAYEVPRNWLHEALPGRWAQPTTIRLLNKLGCVATVLFHSPVAPGGVCSGVVLLRVTNDGVVAPRLAPVSDRGVTAELEMETATCYSYTEGTGDDATTYTQRDSVMLLRLPLRWVGGDAPYDEQDLDIVSVPRGE